MSDFDPLNKNILQDFKYLPSIIVDRLICTATHEDLVEIYIMPMEDNSNRHDHQMILR